jgi:pimeloyl-ACP methyl ester carboxylesterase
MKRLLLFLFLTSLACVAPAKPQSAKKEEAPKVATKVETGELKGARFKIEIPGNWNQGLVLYCHGYHTQAALDEDEQSQKIYDVFLRAGYAVAMSAYSAGGWAVEQAILDTEALRLYFAKKYGAPKETYVTGHSMGGFLTMMLVEEFPQSYDAGLPLCGPLGVASWFMERKPFDERVVFDFYFPGALPSPVKVPADFQMSGELTKTLAGLLDAHPDEAQAVRRFTGIHTNQDVAGWMAFATYILKDLQQRSGGNPFDNHNTIYVNGADDNKLNDGVARYSSDPGARPYLRKYYTPTGDLKRPLLAIHTTYDPIVPGWVPDAYALLTAQTGHDVLFVQQYVKHDGHCEITPEEIARGFAQLRSWKESGTKPPAGWNH